MANNYGTGYGSREFYVAPPSGKADKADWDSFGRRKKFYGMLNDTGYGVDNVNKSWDIKAGNLKNRFSGFRTQTDSDLNKNLSAQRISGTLAEAVRRKWMNKLNAQETDYMNLNEAGREDALDANKKTLAQLIYNFDTNDADRTMYERELADAKYKQQQADSWNLAGDVLGAAGTLAGYAYPAAGVAAGAVKAGSNMMPGAMPSAYSGSGYAYNANGAPYKLKNRFNGFNSNSNISGGLPY